VDAETKPWTIKGISWEVRNAAIAAADRQHATIGEWVSRAVLGQVQAETNQSRAVVDPQADHSAPRSDPADGLDTIERLVAITERLHTLGIPAPKDLPKLMHARLRERLKGLKITPPAP